MSPILSIMKTTATRLSALYLVLFAICAVVLVTYVTSLSERMLMEQTRESIAEEVDRLDRVYQGGGLSDLARLIELRARQPSANLYLITDPDGVALSGNVESIEPKILNSIGWTESPFAYRRFGEGEGGRENNFPTAVAQIIRLPNGMILLVGRDLSDPAKLREIVRRALIAALGMMGLGAFFIWYFVGRRALRRIDSVSEASRQIMGGDLGSRLPVSGAGDEFDRLSESLNGMLERIATLNEGLKQVSDNVAHDLKTPLTRLRNRAEAALNSSNDFACRQALEQTVCESDQLIRVFKAILMISRLETGYSAEEMRSVDLEAIVSDVIELYEPVAEELGVFLAARTTGPVHVNGNRELIGQALSNIVDNALKYSAGTTIRPSVFVSLSARSDSVFLVIRDNGPGIPEEDWERVMERFVRLEKSRTQPGSGLGLSLARAVMIFHGGRLEIFGDGEGLSVGMIFPQRHQQ